MFKVNNNNTRTTSLTSFWCFLLLTLNIIHKVSTVFIVHFEMLPWNMYIHDQNLTFVDSPTVLICPPILPFIWDIGIIFLLITRSLYATNDTLSMQLVSIFTTSSCLAVRTSTPLILSKSIEFLITMLIYMLDTSFRYLFKYLFYWKLFP